MHMLELERKVEKYTGEGEWEERLGGFAGHVKYSGREIHIYKLGLLCELVSGKRKKNKK